MKQTNFEKLVITGERSRNLFYWERLILSAARIHAMWLDHDPRHPFVARRIEQAREHLVDYIEALRFEQLYRYECSSCGALEKDGKPACDCGGFMVWTSIRIKA